MLQSYCSHTEKIRRMTMLQALGVTVDMTSRTMGVRTRRFAMYVDNGEVSSCCKCVA